MRDLTLHPRTVVTARAAARASVRAAAIALLVATWIGCTPAPRESTVASALHSAAAGETAQPASGEFGIYELASRWSDQKGDSMQLGALAGRVRVVAMVYTSCAATCPLIIADLKRIESAIAPQQRDAIGFVLVSLDPWRDTPGRLAEWADKVALDPSRWTLLSGNDDSVRELAVVLDVRYQRQPDGELAHTNGLVVTDKAGRIAYRQIGLGGTDETIRVVQSLLR